MKHAKDDPKKGSISDLEKKMQKVCKKMHEYIHANGCSEKLKQKSEVLLNKNTDTDDC